MDRSQSDTRWKPGRDRKPGRPGRRRDHNISIATRRQLRQGSGEKQEATAGGTAWCS